MAGVKGKCGGARPGAGRPRKPTVPVSDDDPLDFLLRVMRGDVVPSTAQLTAAVAAARLKHQDAGKKLRAAEKAKQAAAGKFAPAPPPKLIVNNR